MKNTILFFVLICSGYISAQSFSYEVKLESVTIPNLGGLQSYSVAEMNGEWLILGGRLDGLHQRQPFAAFDAAGNNIQAFVVNPETKEVWSATYENLNAELKEQLSSTNIQFYKDGDFLILTGGYGFSPTSNDHITFPRITAVNIPALIEEVKNNSISSNSFITKLDQQFAVTGGRLAKIGDRFYLVGGHRFDGRYNPMGPDHGPGFEQEYTHEIRSFELSIEDSEMSINHFPVVHDEMHLRRRDYNLVPQIKNGEEELMIFSGVFKNNSDTPWLYPVQITSDSYTPMEDFTQNFNHYHCPTLPIYNESKDEMHTIFFGGIAQFYMDGDIMVQDNDVPFVNTIANVSRDGDGSLGEQILPTEMPGFLGAGSEFIIDPASPLFNDNIINGDEIGDDYMSVGYIFGGIRSTMPHVFFSNDENASEAVNTVYKVSIRKKTVSNNTVSELNSEKLLIYPNPANNLVRVSILLNEISDINIEVFDMNGRLVGEQLVPGTELATGQNFIVLNKLNVDFGEYLYKFKIDDKVITRKVIWSE